MVALDNVNDSKFHHYLADGIELKGYESHQVLVVDGVVLDGPSLRLDLSLPLVLI